MIRRALVVIGEALLLVTAFVVLLVAFMVLGGVMGHAVVGPA